MRFLGKKLPREFKLDGKRLLRPRFVLNISLYSTDPVNVGHMTWASASGAQIRLNDC